MNDMLNINNDSEKYIAGHRIITELASSTSSRLFLAKHDSSDQPSVVVKLFYSTVIDTPQEIARFLAEMRILRQLQHPSILPILDAGIDKDTPYTIIPHLASGSLYERMQRDLAGPLSIEDAGNILLQIGRALHYAHQHSVFHGNLKPRNVLFEKNGQIQLVDFTCATIYKTVNESSFINPDATFYMAPELFRNSPDALSDQYALGCLAYELFTAHKPFDALFSGEQQREDPPAPTQFNPHLPLPIEQAILKAIAREPEHRYPDIPAFINAILLSPHDASPTPIKIGNEIKITEQNTLALPLRESRTQVFSLFPTREKLQRHKLLVLASCIIVVVLLSGLFSASFLFARTSRNTSTTSSQSSPTTRSTSESAGKMSAPTTSIQANTSPPQSIQQTTPTGPERPATAPNRVPATPRPIVVLNPLQVSPTSFMADNCETDNDNYRCTAELQLSSEFQGKLTWHLSTTGIRAKYGSASGTLSPGKTKQVIIYIHDDCPENGSLIFSGAGYTVKATWNC